MMPAGSATGRDARSRSDAATSLDSSWLVDAGPPLTLPAHPGHLRSSRTAVRAPSPSTSEAHESVHTHAFLSIVKDLERHWRTIHDDGSITRFFDLTTCRQQATPLPERPPQEQTMMINLASRAHHMWPRTLASLMSASASLNRNRVSLPQEIKIGCGWSRF